MDAFGTQAGGGVGGPTVIGVGKIPNPEEAQLARHKKLIEEQRESLRKTKEVVKLAEEQGKKTQQVLEQAGKNQTPIPEPFCFEPTEMQPEWEVFKRFAELDAQVALGKYRTLQVQFATDVTTTLFGAWVSKLVFFKNYQLVAAMSDEAQQLINIYGRVTTGSVATEIVQVAKNMGFTGEVIILRGTGSGSIAAGFTETGELIIFEGAYLQGFSRGIFGSAKSAILKGKEIIAHELGHLKAPIPYIGRIELTKTQLWLREAQASAIGATMKNLTPAQRQKLINDMRYSIQQYRKAGGSWPTSQQYLEALEKFKK